MAAKSVVLFFIAGTALALIFAFFLIYFIVLQRNRRNKYFIDTQNLILEHEAKESKIRLEESERTMLYVAKEIHDNIGQISNMIRMHLHYLETLLENKEQVSVIDRISVLTDKLIGDTNNISHSLNGNFILQWGLQTMIENDLNHIRKSKKIGCELKVIGASKFLNQEQELIIYRIAQESINNIIKHSSAANMVITLNFDSAFFLMKIADNGIGFIYEKVPRLGGTGLVNMKERAKYINGTLDINAVPNEGCTTIFLLRHKID